MAEVAEKINLLYIMINFNGDNNYNNYHDVDNYDANKVHYNAENYKVILKEIKDFHLHS